MRTRDIITGGAFMALGVGAAYLTAGLPERSLPNTPGPAFFPWVIVTLMLGLAGLLLVRGLLMQPEAAAEEEGDEPLVPTGLAITALGGFVVYILALPHLGFLVATAPFFAGLMVLFGERRPLVVTLVALIATIGLYVVFRHAFQIILPQGVLLGIVP